MSNDIDTGLYDRQIRTYGEEAVKKIISSSVTIIGLEDGLSTEIAKNLALGGVKQIFLFDSGFINAQNIETGFYYSSNDLNKFRSEILCNKIQELNPYVNVTTIKSIDEINPNSILIVVNKSKEEILNYESKFNQRMVAVFSKGVAGMVFVNAGKEHIVTDIMGENIEPVQIGSLDNSGKVTCAEHHTHDFQSGDYIKFENLEGNNVEKLVNKEFKIKVLTVKTFQVTDDFDFSDVKLNNGTVTLVKKPITINHQPFSQQLNNPSFNFSFDDSELIFKTLITYFDNKSEFHTNDIWSDEYTNILKKYFDKSYALARTFSCEFMPVYSLIGSIAASETIKLITNKYMPVNQFWCWYEPKLVTDSRPNLIGESSISKLYGVDFESSLSNSSWFVVGSGAIGCELLKNLNYLGVSSTNDGTLYLTDPDNIEKSNLNRQFLFRSHHIGKPKSKMAAEVIKQMKPINIVPLTEKVCKENQVFTDKIMKRVSGVLNALDNIQARRYMDEQCFNYQLPLFESGTTGTKGNTQPVIPFLTETYSNSADPPQEKSFPICTIKNFPNEIQHTIPWAMDYFEVFNRAPQNINKWIKDSSVFENVVSVENSQGKEDVMNFLIKLKINSFEDCVHRAIDMFYDNYKHQIIQLLTTYPPNHTTDEGTPFWSNGKRMPKPFDKFDVSNSYHIDYVEATSHLIARVYQLNDNFSRDYISKVASEYQYVDYFHPNEHMKIPTKDSEIKKEVGIDIVLPDNQPYKNLALKSEEFEKDDPTNWHVSFVTAASNLRALNYNIPPTTYQETKGIAGRIIPAIATTTSAVSGLIVLEMLKYMLAKNKTIENKIENYRSTFVNLADTNLVYSEPIPSGEIEIAGIKFNNWTKFEFKENTTLKAFRMHFEKMFKTKISMIVYDNGILYADFMEDEEQDKVMMSKLVLDKTPDIDIYGGVVISIASSDDIALPQIHFSITKNLNETLNLN